jgi:hypothetical protein
MNEATAELTDFSLSFLLFGGVHQFNGREEPDVLFVMLDCLDSKRCGDVRVVRPGTPVIPPYDMGEQMRKADMKWGV